MKQGKKQTVRCCLRGAAVLFLSAIAASCQDYIPFGEDDIKYGILKPESEYFSYNTTSEVDFSVNYGKRGSRALINIYADNPTYVGDDGEIYVREDADMKVFCDANGKFKGKVTLPTYADKVYIYTIRAGVPQIATAEVKNGVVKLDVSSEKVIEETGTPPGYDENETNGGVIADFEPKASSYDEKMKRRYNIWRAPLEDGRGHHVNKVFSIVNWKGQRFGRIIPTHYYDTEYRRHEIGGKSENGKYYDNQGLIRDDSHVVEGNDTIIGTKDIETIQHFLWNGKNTKPQGLNNRMYYDNIDTEDINTVIPHRYINDEGKLTKVDSAQVWLRFLGEGAHYCDGIGYYYYKTGNPPKEFGKIDKYYVAIPNTSSTAPYQGDGTFLGRTVPFITGNFRYDVGNNNPSTDFISTSEMDDNGKRLDTEMGWVWTFHPKYVPFDINQRVQLLYQEEIRDENGNIVMDETGKEPKYKVSRYFPPGITIGFFLFYKNNSEGSFYPEESRNLKTMTVDNRSGFYHSDWRANYTNGEQYDDKGEGTGNNNKSLRHYIALNYKEFAVYGVEDSGDNSMEDVLFSVETDPIGMTVNDDRFTIEDEIHATNTDYRTYAFEDIWPDGGDYDMNDVVIDHKHRMTFKRSGNADGTPDNDTSNDPITKIEDVFTKVQPDNAATYVDAFAIRIPRDHLNMEQLELYEGSGESKKKVDIDSYIEDDPDDEEAITLILFKNVMDTDPKKPQSMTVIRRFNENSPNPLYIGTTTLEQTDDEGITRNVLNPFIISQYDKVQKHGRTEIHLPHHKATNYVDRSQLNTQNDAYYTTRDTEHNYPFAISLPKSVLNDWGQHFTERDGEGIEIDDEKAYPYFRKWVNSNGAECQDWYLHYRVASENQ